jgi:hypothetical protein
MIMPESAIKMPPAQPGMRECTTGRLRITADTRANENCRRWAGVRDDAGRLLAVGALACQRRPSGCPPGSQCIPRHASDAGPQHPRLSSRLLAEALHRREAAR